LQLHPISLLASRIKNDQIDGKGFVLPKIDVLFTDAESNVPVFLRKFDVVYAFS
jgi:hypothetical protein